jgi:citryl-CoA synthetase large subunit
MILYEFEGKELLKKAGIKVPSSQLIDSPEVEIVVLPPLVLKAQVLSGKRADVGGIIKINKGQLTSDNLNQLFGVIINNEKVEKVLVEEMIDFEEPEYYLSVSYDTETRGPLLTISESGGTGIEKRAVQNYSINSLNWQDDKVLSELAIPQDLITKVIHLFFDEDCTLLEINPLVKDKKGEWYALDAKIKLDEVAQKRHTDWNFSPRSIPGYQPTKNEIAAKKIDEDDYRGTAGSAYFDLDGDIAVLSSGGGISLTALDALTKLGAKPANFTEYSGNPPKEKVVKLTKIVLNKLNIHGLWVIGTVAANFTDIYETLLGLVEGLRQAEAELHSQFDFPIVIRRGGPREEEAFAMLRTVKDFDLHLYGEEVSVAESAKIMADLAKKYALK